VGASQGNKEVGRGANNTQEGTFRFDDLTWKDPRGNEKRESGEKSQGSPATALSRSSYRRGAQREGGTWGESDSGQNQKRILLQALRWRHPNPIINMGENIKPTRILPTEGSGRKETRIPPPPHLCPPYTSLKRRKNHESPKKK